MTPIGYARLDDLVSPYGPISVVAPMGNGWKEPLPFEVYTSSVGTGVPGLGAPGEQHIICGGRADTSSPELARLIAIAEGAERYALGDRQNGADHLWATAQELGDRCIEPWRIPACSAAELAHPDCKVINFDPAARVRWTEGVDLLTGGPVLVPSAMVCVPVANRTPDETFNVPISTGYAVHTDAVKAVISGLCEVVERDIISVLWHHRLRLPRVHPDHFDKEIADTVEWCRRRFVDTHLFDATSDLGIPIAYCLVRAPHDPEVATVVGAGTGRDIREASLKALREAVGIRQAIRAHGGDARKPYREYRSVEDGASFLALPENNEAFDFLVEPTRHTRNHISLPTDPRACLDRMLDALRAACMRPVLVDRTTCELRNVGLTAVTVVVPDLQPMSVDPLVQYKAHPRLYALPERMGFPSLDEKELNPWPQPFA
ncbi:YcaO-like family protein [Streptomyces adustus]|uniref:YcaO-like family protein n=1 Tax=Streptomyces adustus TaxID=1609272 RepID=UPI0035DAC15E